MIFLKASDFKISIKDNIIQALISADKVSADNLTLVSSEKQAIAIVKSYLKDRFDLDYLLSRENDDRDIILIDMLINIIIYNLMRRISVSDAIPEIRQIEYNNSIQMLKDLRDGKINPEGWPLRQGGYDYNLSNIYISTNKRWNNLDY